MILAMTPCRRDQNLGRAYNEAMDRLRDDDVAVFIDHDAMFMTMDWLRQIEDALAFDPTALFACVTNRIAAPWQRATEVDYEDHDLQRHSAVAQARLSNHNLLDVTDTKGIGGVMMAVSKDSWMAAGGFVDGMFCVDHNFHFAMKRSGLKVYVIEGLYVYHRRRAFGVGLKEVGPRAPVKALCACRGIEHQPTVRVRLGEAVTA